MKNLLLLAFFLIISCKKEKSETFTANQKAMVSATPTPRESNPDSVRKQAINYFLNNKDFYFSKLNNTIGVVTATDNLHFGDTVRLLNENKVTDSLYIYNEEYQVSTFNCISNDSLYYKISSGKTEFYLNKSDKLQFEPWEIHVLNVGFVGFDYITNTIHTSPSEDSDTIIFDPFNFYSPVQIAGQWMQIVWSNDTDDYHYGWIKWKEDDKLIIELFYFS